MDDPTNEKKEKSLELQDVPKSSNSHPENPSKNSQKRREKWSTRSPKKSVCSSLRKHDEGTRKQSEGTRTQENASKISLGIVCCCSFIGVVLTFFAGNIPLAIQYFAENAVASSEASSSISCVAPYETSITMLLSEVFSQEMYNDTTSSVRISCEGNPKEEITWKGYWSFWIYFGKYGPGFLFSVLILLITAFWAWIFFPGSQDMVKKKTFEFVEDVEACGGENCCALCCFRFWLIVSECALCLPRTFIYVSFCQCCSGSKKKTGDESDSSEGSDHDSQDEEPEEIFEEEGSDDANVEEEEVDSN